MNPYLARSLAIVAALAAYMAGHAVGYLRSGHDHALAAMLQMLETRSEIEKGNGRAALIALDAGLENQGQLLNVAQKPPAGEILNYGLLAFSTQDEDKEEQKERLTRQVFRQKTPLPATVLKSAGRTMPLWANPTRPSPHLGQDTHPLTSDPEPSLPQGVYQR